jgi:hypothetical protein
LYLPLWISSRATPPFWELATTAFEARSSKPCVLSRLRGRIKIKDADVSTFVAEQASEPAKPIPEPPSYRDKWRRR